MKAILFIFLALILICGTLHAQDTNSEASGMKSIRKNSFYLDVLGSAAVYSVNYDRILPLSNNLAITLRVDVNEYHGEATDTLSFNFLGAAGVLYGGPKHLFDSNIGYTYFMHDPDRLVVFSAGYRRQSPKGLIVRATPMCILTPKKEILSGILYGLDYPLGIHSEKQLG